LTAALQLFDAGKSTNAEIGNVILENFTPFDDELPLVNVGLNDLNVRFNYIEGPDPIAAYVAESNHVRNGLLLRADMHLLFDLGLLTLSDDLEIHVSKRLVGRNVAIECLHGTKAYLQSALDVRPAPDAIEFHRGEIFC
jgi:hypothetical protein